MTIRYFASGAERRGNELAPFFETSVWFVIRTDPQSRPPASAVVRRFENQVDPLEDAILYADRFKHESLDVWISDSDAPSATL